MIHRSRPKASPRIGAQRDISSLGWQQSSFTDQAALTVASTDVGPLD
jgi:hypothetical protein